MRVADAPDFGYGKKVMKRWYWAGLGVTAVAIASCSDEPLRCGPGTARKGNECLGLGSAHSGGSTGNGAGGTSAGGDAGSAGDHSDGTGGDPDSNGGAPADGESGGAPSDGESSGGSAGEGGAGGSAGGGAEPIDVITSDLGCGSHNVTGATVVTDPITQDTVWSGVIHLPKGLSMRNEPTLTIAPGTKIIVGHDATVEFGWPGGGHATIVAAGTLEAPILFCGETDTAGYWAGMVFRSGVKSASVFKNVLIADAGGTDAALTLEMPLLVQGVQVRNSGSNGVNTVGFAPQSSTLIVSGATNTAVKATKARGAEVPVGSRLAGNGLDLIDLAFTSVDASVTLRNLSVPYSLSGMQIAGGATVTLESGVRLLIAPGGSIDVLAAGALKATGTSESKIQLSPRDSSNWGGITAELGATVQLVDVVIDHAGGGGVLTSAISAKTPIQLSDSTISHSATWGLKKAASDLTDYLTGNTFEGNVSGDVTDF
ncbi:MAG TPA: hypothetical protein VHM25_00450 [Polyangiaceae bacterium]|jgi:hypothetical protein|nr:hypothetical protein [Polyangiaceae bacterium]